MLIAAAVLLGWRHYRAIMRPVQQLSVTSRRLAAGEWRQRAAPSGDRELAAMASVFNHMAEQLETLYRDLESQVRTRSEQLVRTERLATVGLLAAGVAHEINNPLAIISGQAELALTRGADHRLGENLRDEALRQIVEETQRCKAITQKMHSLARPSPSQRCRLEVQRVVVAAIDAMAGLAIRKGCHLTVQEAPVDAIWVEADELELRQILINLLLNATEAVTDEGGRVDVAVACSDGEVGISVMDNGGGMDAATLSHLFEPFFTRRHGRPGLGLGLAVSHAIAASHGGELVAESDGPGRGSRVTLRLPRLRAVCEVGR